MSRPNKHAFSWGAIAFMIASAIVCISLAATGVGAAALPITVPILYGVGAAFGMSALSLGIWQAFDVFGGGADLSQFKVKIEDKTQRESNRSNARYPAVVHTSANLFSESSNLEIAQQRNPALAKDLADINNGARDLGKNASDISQNMNRIDPTVEGFKAGAAKGQTKRWL